MLSIFLRYILTFSFITSLWATDHMHGDREGHKHGSHQECELPTSTQSIIDCALELHPSLKIESLVVDSSDKAYEQAQQRPNPTLNTRYVKDDSSSGDISELEANLNFVVELGDKREGRKNYAKALKRRAVADLKILRADIKKEVILNLVRLRQLANEEIYYQDTILAFSKVIKSLKGIPRLTAEQEASVSLFELALAQTQLQRSKLYAEHRKVAHYFHIVTGHSLEELEQFLPKFPSSWPSIPSLDKKGESPELNKLKSLSQLATTQLELEKSNAWPDLRIGPAVLIERNGSVKNEMIGLSFQLPLPLFQTNSGGKALAKSKELIAMKKVENQYRLERHERFELLQVYESSVNSLRQSLNIADIEKRHKKIKKLYERGVVQSSIYLDSLRQRLSLLETKNRQESAAIEALWSIYKIDGSIMERTL